MATIQGVYVALFGRPADPAGLAYFEGVTNGGKDLAQIANLAGQKEFTDLYAGKNNVQIINQIYQQLFNRDAEAAGRDFFLDKLNKGELNVNNIAIAILDSAQGNDKTIVTNKVAAADLFTKSLDTPTEQGSYNGDAANASARAWLSGVTTTAQTQAQVDAEIKKIVDTGAQGKIDIVATVIQDVSPTSATAALKTTNLDDVVTISVNAATVLNGGFTGKVDGGFGNDTVKLNVTGETSPGGAGVAGTAAAVGAAGAGNQAAPTWTNVEKIAVAAVAGAGEAGNAGNVGGAADVWLSLANAKSVNDITLSATAGTTNGLGAGGAAQVTVTDALVGSKINVTTAVSGDLSVSFRDATGTSDAATLNLAKAVFATGTTLTVNDIESLSITLDATKVATLDGSSIKDVVLTGTGGLSAAAANTATVFGSTTLKTLDASAVNGSGINVSVAAATNGVTVTGTKFADIITLNNTGGVTTDKDVIVYSQANISTQSVQDKIVNFTSGEDKLDVKAFGITSGTANVTTFGAAPVDGASFLGNAAAQHNGLLYIDTNKDGIFNAATDFVVDIGGAVAATDILWA